MLKHYTKGFTLVELIVVITILAILGTIAFISLQGYSKTARDSTRISDINTIESGLELFTLEAGYYPIPDDGVEITFSGSEVWTQGVIGDNVMSFLQRLNKKPVDPLVSSQYTYSRLNSKQEIELAGALEASDISQISQSYAGNKLGTAYIEGNYNGAVAKVLTGAELYILAVPTIISGDITQTDYIGLVDNNKLIINGGNALPASYEGSNFNTDELFVNGVSSGSVVVYNSGASLPVNQDELDVLINNLQNVYSTSQISNVGNISAIVNETNNDNLTILVESLVENNLGGTVEVNLGAETGIITQAMCLEAGWFWVTSGDDVYIGSSQGEGFCISPRFGDWNDTDNGAGAIPFNGWGNYSGKQSFMGWDASGVRDTGNGNYVYGQTRSLDSEVSYSCTALGSASSDFDTTDDIVGRMKWLATTGNSYSEARSIDWITGLVPHTVGSNPHAIPALYIADCIDGQKDLLNDMTYIHSDNSSDEVTYSEYNTDETIDSASALPGNITYQNRQKYLTAWTQKSGSHLPSAFSYINDGNAGPCTGGGPCNSFTGSTRGEYQAACEEGYLSDASDLTDSEGIWLSAVGFDTGLMWGNVARFTYYGCGNISGGGHTGDAEGSFAARFVVRP